MLSIYGLWVTLGWRTEDRGVVKKWSNFSKTHSKALIIGYSKLSKKLVPRAGVEPARWGTAEGF